MNGNIDFYSGGKMAILVDGGAQEQMDVSIDSIDDSSSYVAINVKGSGRQIQMRPDESDLIASQIHNGSYTGPIGPNAQCNEYGIDDSSKSFLDKKTGSALRFNDNIAEVVDKLEKNTEGDEISDQELNAKVDSAKLESQLDITEENRAEVDDRFRLQSTVVSLGKKSKLDKPEILNTPAKKKYHLSQRGTKKIGGTKKNSPGKVNSSFKIVKRPAPYPSLMNLSVKDVVDKLFVDEDGKMLQWKLKLVPVDMDVALKKVDGMQFIKKQSSENAIFLEGSIDRPPDEVINLEDNYNPTEAVHAVAHTQPSTTYSNYVGSNTYSHSYQDATLGTKSAPYIYEDDSDQPLDLTVQKPLDLSMKNKPENKVEDFCPDEDDEEVDHVIWNAPASEMNEESNITDYRTQCSSVSSIFDKGSIQGDETYDSLTDHFPSENDQQNNDDGNLPSLGILTLENKNHAQKFTTVQDSTVREAMVNNVQCQDNTVSGQQNILNLVTSGQVSWEQLFALYYKNQSQKSANIPTASLSQLATKQGPNMSQAQLPQSQIDVPHSAEIPAPAMPNLFSLELADNEGGILVKEQERLKNNLKEKICRKSRMQDND